QLAALRDDERLHVDGHVLEDLDRNVVAPDPLDVVDADLAAVDADLARAPDLVGDVGGRHRAEEDAVRAGLDVEPKHGLPERLGDLLALLEARGLVPRANRVALLELGDTGRRRLV